MRQSKVLILLRLYITLLLIFVTQKVVFMLVNIGLADGAPFGSCVAALWHGLRLDSVTACYLLLLPAVAILISFFVKKFPLRKVLKPYYIIVAALLSLIFVADTVLYLFWGAKLDANDLMYAAKPKDMLASLPVWAIVLAVAVVLAVAYHYTRRLLHATPEQTSLSRSRWYSLVMLPLFGLLVLGMRGGVSESTANPSYAYFSSHPFCNHAALNPTFNMLHSLFKVQDIGSEFQGRSDDEVAMLLSGVFDADGTITDTLLNTTRPNVLLLIWESGGSGMVMNDSVGPNIMALSREGVCFSNCYANNFRTDRGLVSVLNGWLGLPTTSLMKRTDLCRNLPSIAQMLRAEGYATSFTYGGDIDFTNMRLYLSETGFDEVRGSGWFPRSQYESAWGVPDHYLLTPRLLPGNGPFFAAALTLSSHEPWDVPMHRLSEAKPNAFAYTDSCIGAFVSYLKTTPLWDSLLVIVVPDHGIPYGDVHSTSDVRAARIPMVWVGGAVRRPCEIDCLMSQSDLAATLLAQLGLDTRSFVFSRNVLALNYSSRKQFAMHAYKNGANIVMPDGVYTYDCIDRSLAPADTSVQAFTEALLQHLYQTTARLSQR